MRVLLLTDSVALPRKYKNGEVLWEEIYVNLLRKEFQKIEFIHVGIGGGTITDLLSQINYYKNTNPDLVILHVGIVDCAPRAFGRIELEIIKKLHIFRVVKYFSKFLRKHRGITYTNLKNFEETISKFKEIFAKCQIWAIGIIPGCVEYDLKVPGISENIKSYNKILKSNLKFIDLKNIPREGIIEDFHHINAEGHRYIFSLIKEEINKFITRR